MFKISTFILYAFRGVLLQQVAAQGYGFEDLPSCGQTCAASTGKAAGCSMSSAADNVKCLCPHSSEIASCAAKSCDFFSGKSVPQILSFICSSVGNQDPSSSGSVPSTASTSSPTTSVTPTSLSSTSTDSISLTSKETASQTTSASSTNTSSATTTTTPVAKLDNKTSQSSLVVVVQTVVDDPSSTDVPGSTSSALRNLSGSHSSIQVAGICLLLAVLVLVF